MAIQAAKLIVEIGADIGKLQDGLKRSDDALSSFSRTSLKTGAILTASITTPALVAAKSIFDIGASLEQSKVGFTTMLGSAQKAEAMLKQLRDFADRTPFGFSELQDAARRMLAFGFSAQQVLPMLTKIGDAAAGLQIGSEGVQRITLALGQMQAKAKVSAEEMLQLTEAGIPAWRYLAETMGKSTAEVMKLSEQGLIPVDKAIQAILAGLEKDFGGLMAEQSKTAAGQVSTLKDEIEGLASDFSEFLLPVAKDLIATAREGVQWLRDLPDPVKKSVFEFGALAAATGPMLIGLSGITTGLNTLITAGRGAVAATGALSKAFSAFNSGLSLTSALGAAGLSPMVITLGAIATAVGSIVAVWAQWNKQIVQTNKEGVKAVKSAWSDFFDKQIEQGRSATEILNEYRAAQERVNEAMKFSATAPGWGEQVAKLFIDKSAVAKASADELADALLRASKSYQEYVLTLQSAGLTDHLMSEAEWMAAVRGEVEGLSDAIDGAGPAVSGLAVNMGFLEQSAKNNMSGLDGLIGKYDELKGKMQDWLESVASQTYDMLRNKFAEGSQVFRDALAVLDQQLGTNYLEQLNLKDAVKQLVDQYARTKDLDAFRQGLQKIRDEGMAKLKEQLEEVTKKAQQLYDNLLKLPAEIRIKVGFDVEKLPDWINKAGTVGTGNKGGEMEKRASGGAVWAGEPYLVGERGPELFIPRISGTIVPTERVGRGAGIVIENVNITFRDTDLSPEALAFAMRQLEWRYS